MEDNIDYLSDVASDKRFILSNGKPVSGLESLYDAVWEADDAVFYNHVTPDRNDFANWIKYVIKDEALAGKIADIKEKEVFLGVLAEEIATIKNSRKTAKDSADSSTRAPSGQNPGPQSDSQMIGPDMENYEFEQVMKNVIDELDSEISNCDNL